MCEPARHGFDAALVPAAPADQPVTAGQLAVELDVTLTATGVARPDNWCTVRPLGRLPKVHRGALHSTARPEAIR